jgi:hypothetical protein
MRGYGDREWAVYAQAVALRLVLQRRCARLVVVPVGGEADGPGGSTDLASGVLGAVAHAPDLIAVVSDGYENVHPGDLARVVASLPRVGMATPVVFCHSTFGHSDDLRLRRPAPGLPQRAGADLRRPALHHPARPGPAHRVRADHGDRDDPVVVGRAGHGGC